MSQHHPRRALLPSIAITVLVSTLAVAAPVSGASDGYTNPQPITIDTLLNGTSGANDSDIELGAVAGQGSSAVEVDAPAGAYVVGVYIHLSLTHERVDDVDLMLVSPAGKGAMLLSDVGGDNPFDNGAGSQFGPGVYMFHGGQAYSDNTLEHGFGSPTDWDTTPGDTDTFPAPAPATAPDSMEEINGTQVDGTWTLYAVDDTDGSTGTVHDWDINVTYGVSASPGASPLSVAGLANGITDVNLSLNDMDLTFLGETEVVLESPDGRRAHVVSDAGGWGELTDVTVTLDDEADEPLRYDRAPSTRAYRPANYDGGDVSEYVGGFDTKSLSSSLSTFDGANPNGTWKLYVAQEECFCRDDAKPINAISGGWSLDITTADAPSAPGITSPANGSSDADGAVTVTGSATAGALVKVTTGDKTLNTVADGGVWTVTFADLADGSHTFTATATDSSGNVSAPATVTVTVARPAAPVAPVLDEADTTAPKVRTVKPRKDEDRINVSASAMVRFSEAMDVASVKRAVKLVSVETGKAVDVKLTYKASKNKVTIDPKQDLDHDTTYLVVVKTSAKDLAGNALVKTRKSRFNTL